MLHVFVGERSRAMEALRSAAGNVKGATVLRVSDASSPQELATAFGRGLFKEKKVVIMDSVFENAELKEIFLAALEGVAHSDDHIFVFAEKVDAKTRKTLEKYGKLTEYKALARKESGSIFALANALQRGDKKGLWIGLERELLAGSAPEAIHGVLFWGAKQMLLSARDEGKRTAAKRYVATLAELPHAARRGNVPLDHALIQFALSLA